MEAEEARATTVMTVFSDHSRIAHWDNIRAMGQKLTDDGGRLRELTEGSLDSKIGADKERDRDQERDRQADEMPGGADKDEAPGHADDKERHAEKEADKNERPKEKHKDAGKEKSKERSLKRDREERDAPGPADGNGVIEEYEGERKRGRDAEERKAVDEKKHHKEHKESREHKEEIGHDGEEREPIANTAIQQKRRMRARQSQQATTASRSRLRTKDLDGSSHARQETSAIVYKVGEGLPELERLRSDYQASLAVRSGDSSSLGPTVEIRIAPELATTSNKQVRGSQLWGTDIYTDDSDIVAVLMHTGYYTPVASPPPPSFTELRATIRVLPPQDCYISTLRNCLRSRAWGAASMCSYKVEGCRVLKAAGEFTDLAPCLTRLPAAAPTLSIAATERTVTTRASSSSYRQQRYIQEVTVQYNLLNEPWLKYNMNYVADKGLKNSMFTSARLKKGEVLYVETRSHRFELSYEGDTLTGVATAPSGQPAHDKGKDKGHEKHEKLNGEAHHELYKWAKCKTCLPLGVMMVKGMPLPSAYVEVLHDGLRWEEIQWSQTSVWVREKEYVLARAQFLSSKNKN